MPHKRTVEPTKDELVAAAIEFLLEENPDYLNAAMAERATKELNREVSSKDISRVRNAIGRGFYQTIIARAVRDATGSSVESVHKVTPRQE